MKYVVILILLIVSIMITMTLCFFPGCRDFSYPVAGKYMLNRTSAHTVFIALKDGWNDKIPIIREKVIEIAWNKKYVIAKKQEMTRRSPNNANDPYMEPVPNKFSYWVLDTEESKVIGPLSLVQMNKIQANLGINLILKDVYNYSWKHRFLKFLYSISQ